MLRYGGITYRKQVEKEFDAIPFSLRQLQIQELLPLLDVRLSGADLQDEAVKMLFNVLVSYIMSEHTCTYLPQLLSSLQHHEGGRPSRWTVEE